MLPFGCGLQACRMTAQIRACLAALLEHGLAVYTCTRCVQPGGNSACCKEAQDNTMIALQSACGLLVDPHPIASTWKTITQHSAGEACFGVLSLRSGLVSCSAACFRLSNTYMSSTLGIWRSIPGAAAQRRSKIQRAKRRQVVTHDSRFHTCRNTDDAVRLQVQRNQLIVGVQNPPCLHGIIVLSSGADVDLEPLLGGA